MQRADNPRPSTAAATVAVAGRPRVTLLLCTLAALAEGFDNQAMGVAAPKLVREFALSAGQASLIFSAGTLGLFLGAAIGGRWADRVGRRRVLIASMLLFGGSALLTAAARGPVSFLLIRLLTGLGLGGAMPNFIALSSEAVHERRRVSAVTVVMAGMPLGGALAGLMALGETLGWDWRVIFYVGGAVPLLLALLLSAWLPRGRPARPEAGAASPALESVGSVLFGSQRAVTTGLLWGGFFFTQLILLLMLNWLPSLVVGLGFSAAQASLASVVFNVAGSLGAMQLGRLHAGTHRRRWVIITYAGMAVALALLPEAHSFALALLAIALAGIVIIGAQLILFALAPLYYPRPIRGTGVGAAVSIGRLGSVFGPLYAGALLSAGGGSGVVLLGIIPFVLLGGSAALALTRKPQCTD